MHIQQYIPPTSSPPPLTYGTLTFSSQSPLLHHTPHYSAQHSLTRLHLWGAAHPISLVPNRPTLLPISASTASLKQYLTDCKASRVEVVDSRNQKGVAVGYLNWSRYLRAPQDQVVYEADGTHQQPYFLPFYDEKIMITLPLYPITVPYNVTRSPIGQICLEWECWVQAVTLPSKSRHSRQISAMLAVPNDNVQVPISTCNIQMVPDEVTPPSTEQQLAATHLRASQQNWNPRRSNFSIRDSNLAPPLRETARPLTQTQHSSVRNKDLAAQIRQTQALHQLNPQRTYEDSSLSKKNPHDLDVELVRVRLQMEALVGKTQKEQSLIMQIISYQSHYQSTQAKDLSNLDIVMSHPTLSKKQWKASPVQVQGQVAFFNTNCALQKDSSVSVVAKFSGRAKQVIKGQTTVNKMAESHDINLLTSNGVVSGYLRVTIKRQLKAENTIQESTNQSPNKTETHKKSRDNQLLNQQKNIKTQILPRQSQNYLSRQQQEKSALIVPEEERFFITVIKNLRPSFSCSYHILQTMLNPQQPLAFILQKMVQGKPLTLVIKDKTTMQTKQQIILPKLTSVPVSSFNLTCSLIHEHQSPKGHSVQLYSGNLKQLNYFMQKHLPATNQPPEHLERASRQRQSQPERKLKTEEQAIPEPQEQGRRKTTQQEGSKQENQAWGRQQEISAVDKATVSAHRSQSMTQHQQPPPQEDIYLVELLTKFLEIVTSAQINSEGLALTRQAFIERFTVSEPEALFQSDLVEVISAIFQLPDQDNMIDLDQLQHCHKAYQSFLKLYTQQRHQLFSMIGQKHSHPADKIKTYSQLGSINETLLWGKALKKVTDPNVKERINKFYKLSSFSNTDPALLLQDLEGNMESKQLRSLDISNLSLLVKQSVEQYLSQASRQQHRAIEEELKAYDTEGVLNIRDVASCLDMAMQLSVSLWESMLLIEEIKGTHNCDLTLQEGVISANSLLQWVSSLFPQYKPSQNVSEHSQSDIDQSLDPQEQALLEKIRNSNTNPKENEVQRIQKSVAQSMQKSGSHQANNDSQILDIANLLRAKDGIIPAQIDKVEPPLVEILRVDKHVTQNSEQQDLIQSQEAIQQEQLHDKPKVEQVEEKMTLTICVKVESLKIFDGVTAEAFKMQFSGLKSVPKSHFSYLTHHQSYQDATHKCFPFEVSQQGLNDSVLNITLSPVNKEKDKQCIKGCVSLSELAQAEQGRKKTVVLYQGGQIAGKVTLSRQKEIPPSSNEESLQTIEVTLRRMTPPIDMTLMVKVSDEEQEISKELILNERICLALKRPLYHSALIITDSDQQHTCKVELEELYLRGCITAQFPLTNILNGTHTTSLTLALAHPTHRLEGHPKPAYHEVHSPSKRQQQVERIKESRHLRASIDQLYRTIQQKYAENR